MKPSRRTRGYSDYAQKMDIGTGVPKKYRTQKLFDSKTS
jgi:hypothetical protein